MFFILNVSETLLKNDISSPKAIFNICVSVKCEFLRTLMPKKHNRCVKSDFLRRYFTRLLPASLSLVVSHQQ